MTKSTGLAAVRERIRQSFLAVHNDQRDREQRQADQEMLTTIQSETAAEPEEETVETTDTTRLSTEERANIYVKAALRAPHIVKHIPRRTNVHGAYVIEEPREDAATLIAQAMRSLK
jgi:hypothetical protein